MRNDSNRRDPPEAYTDETIVMPRYRPPGERPPQRASPPRAPLPQRSLRPPRRRIWPIVRNTVLVVLILAVVGLVLLYSQVAGVASEIVVGDARPPGLGLGSGSNVLIIGTDERVGAPEEGVRGDTLIVAHMDTAGRWVNLLSIPRDTRVDLLDIGPTKINVAYGQGYARAEELYGAGTTAQQGGMALAAQTVEQLLDMGARGQRINYTAQINFDGFSRIIDALGGVTIDVPYAIVDDEYPTEDFGIQRIEFQPGAQRMDGERALIYARTRHGSSDFERAARQQQVMRAIVDEIRGRGPLGTVLLLPKLREGLAGAVTTTMPVARIDVLLGLMWLASGLNPDEIGQHRLSPEIDPGMQEDGAFNLVWSAEGLSAAMDALLTPPSEVSEAATVQVLNGTGVTGLAGTLTGELENQGFSVVPAGDGPSSDVPTTLVYNVNNKPRTAQRLAQLLGGEVRSGVPEGVVPQTDIVVILGQNAVPE